NSPRLLAKNCQTICIWIGQRHLSYLSVGTMPTIMPGGCLKKPAKNTGCPVKQNGNTRHQAARALHSGGALMKKLVKPTVLPVKVSLIHANRPKSEVSSPTSSVSMIQPETWLNGYTIAGMT